MNHQLPIEIHRKLLLAFLFVGLCGVLLGYEIGVRDGSTYVLQQQENQNER